jgi:signal transduction histidine kinase
LSAELRCHPAAKLHSKPEIDVMHPNGGCLSYAVTKARFQAARKGTKILIANIGSGISPDALKKIFEPFFTTKGSKGNGLGLWVSKEIIQRHQGEIKVRSSQNPKHCGTVFTLFMPSEGINPENAQSSQ